MINATVGAKASVNFGAREWIPIAGDPRVWTHVDRERQQGNELDWRHFTTLLIELRDHVIICAADKIAHVPGTETAWHIEEREGGRIGKRENGIMLTYVIAKSDVIREGLPHVAQVEAAFRDDARKILEEAYRIKVAGPALERSFEPSKQPHQRVWAQFESDIKKKLARAEGEISKEMKASKATPRGGMSRSGFMTGATVTIGAIVIGYLAWKIFHHEEKPRQDEAAQR